MTLETPEDPALPGLRAGHAKRVGGDHSVGVKRTPMNRVRGACE